MLDLKKLSEPLTTDQIDFRVQSINKGGYATILAYKDARVDMQRLDDAVGALNWKREHTANNHNCIVSIWNDEIREWISKEDTGTQSNTEAAKGLASDSFKRACFNWGIGRELYGYPAISIKLKANEFKVENNKAKSTWDFQLKHWVWFSKFDGNNKLCMLFAKDQGGAVRYEWRSLNLVEHIAKALLEMMANEENDSIVEAWLELEEWEEILLNTAKSKGGWFDTSQRKLIKDLTFQAFKDKQ